MRIQGVKFLSFKGYKSGGGIDKKDDSKKHIKTKRRENTKQRYNGYDLSYYGFSTSKSSPSRQALKSDFFDLNEIINSPSPVEKVEDKPLSFDESHAKLKLDKYQKEAVEAFNSGNTTIVTAPTGTGKTLIAEHAIKNSLENGKKIIYLSPLKALSNEKYGDFAKLFGNYDENGNLINTDNVGLLTGDVSINPDAPVVVMTTEIYKNSLLALSEDEINERYKDYDGVIYDEFHYLGDKSRGTIWEEAVIHTPKHIKQLMLSATASNADEIKNWIGELNGSINISLVKVPEEERHVPLREFVLTKKDGKINFEDTKRRYISPDRFRYTETLSDRQKAAFEEFKEAIHLEDDEEAFKFLQLEAGNHGRIKLDDFVKIISNNGIKKDKAESIALILADKNSTSYKKIPEGEISGDYKLSEVVRELDKKNMTPALVYIFSKKRCNEEQLQVAEHSNSLLTTEESKRVYDEVKKCEDEGIYLGSDFSEEELVALMKGFAVHHAGKLPAYKSLVENLARKGLVKVCFATETLIAGINMPFRTTVFTQLDKFDGEETVEISTSLYKQGAGRSGRRGKDEIGNVVVMLKNFEDWEQYLELSKSTDTSIASAQNPSYASILSDKMLNKTDEFLLSSLSAYQKGDKLEKTKESIEKKLVMLKEYGFISEDENGYLTRTQKGEVAKKVYGINEIIFTEILTSEDYLKDVDEDGLIAICASLADVKDEDPQRNFGAFDESTKNSMFKICDLIDEVDLKEKDIELKDKNTPFSTNLAPYIVKFANSPSNKKEALESWDEVIGLMRNKELISHEGDFLRVVNSTIDLLKVIKSASENEEHRKKADLAIEKLMKPPVQDIYNYELKENIKISNTSTI